MIDKSDVNRALLTAAALIGAAGVALAAKGSHANQPDSLIAGAFLLVHAPVLLGLSLLVRNRLTQIAAYVLVVALLLFAGDLAALDQLHHPLFPLAAPIGGGGLMLGWLVLAVSAWVGWRRVAAAPTSPLPSPPRTRPAAPGRTRSTAPRRSRRGRWP